MHFCFVFCGSLLNIGENIVPGSLEIFACLVTAVNCSPCFPVSHHIAAMDTRKLQYSIIMATFGIILNSVRLNLAKENKL